MKQKTHFLIFVLVLAGLNLGTVRKAEDPIRDTQTDGILYEQKKEEDKDGKKGPLMYHVKNNPRESFFIDPPFSKQKKDTTEVTATGKASLPSDTSGWWEEQPTATQETPVVEAPSESPPEPASETETVRGLETTEQPDASPEARESPSGKAEEYWW